MKAAVRTRYGPPDVVRIADMDKPAITDGEVLVKVHAATVNRTDCGFRAGKPFIVRFFAGLIRPRARVLGTEFAGVVEAAGGGVTSFEAGDRVFGFSEGSFGAHAEYLPMPGDGPLAIMPANMTFEQVAASTEGSHYAAAGRVVESRIRGARSRGANRQWCAGLVQRPVRLVQAGRASISLASWPLAIGREDSTSSSISKAGSRPRGSQLARKRNPAGVSVTW